MVKLKKKKKSPLAINLLESGKLEREVILMKSKANILMGLSVLAVILAATDFIFKMDVMTLAGTQWILIAIVFGIYALFAKENA